MAGKKKRSKKKRDPEEEEEDAGPPPPASGEKPTGPPELTPQQRATMTDAGVIYLTRTGAPEGMQELSDYFWSREGFGVYVLLFALVVATMVYLGLILTRMGREGTLAEIYRDLEDWYYGRTRGATGSEPPEPEEGEGVRILFWVLVTILVCMILFIAFYDPIVSILYEVYVAVWSGLDSSSVRVYILVKQYLDRQSRANELTDWANQITGGRYIRDRLMRLYSSSEQSIFNPARAAEIMNRAAIDPAVARANGFDWRALSKAYYEAMEVAATQGWVTTNPLPLDPGNFAHGNNRVFESGDLMGPFGTWALAADTKNPQPFEGQSTEKTKKFANEVKLALKNMRTLLGGYQLPLLLSPMEVYYIFGRRSKGTQVPHVGDDGETKVVPEAFDLAEAKKA